MSTYLIKGETLTDIAEAIRSGKGTTDLINPTKFAEEIAAFLKNFRDSFESDAVDLIIPYGTTRLANRIFAYQENIKSIQLPNTLTSIGGSVFERGRGLKSIVIPDSVIAMDHYAFYGHYDIEDVVIGNGVPMIGYQCFYDCRSLKSVTVGSGLTEVGQYAFQNCPNCLTYDFSNCANIPGLINTNAFEGINANAKILIPGDKWLEWSTASNWLRYADYFVKLFNITVCGQEVKVVEAQTWQEWIDSRWNTIGATNHDGIVYVNEKPLYCHLGGYADTYVDDYLVKANYIVDTAYSHDSDSNYVAFKLCGKWTFGLSGTVLENWINSPFNDLGAFINTDTEEYWVELGDGTIGTKYSTREVVSDIEMYDGAVYW